jgi:hypothetical protein|tara:strand:+ start:805 stop:1494 length:690 start_codon:yes stop_codon:yes gene_type:complete
MASTYLTLCNLVIRRLNEVELTASDFATATGIQALVKDAVRSSIARINQMEFEWPFNAAEETDTLIVGQEEYVWPSFFKAVDWNTFQIQASTSLGSSFSTLKFIERDTWYKTHRDADDTAGTAGRSIPLYVFPAHGSGYGVSPSPDKTYALKFRYFLNFTDVTNHDDVTRIPESYDNVLIDGAIYHMYLFKDNLEAAQLANIAFEKGVKNLQSLYINTYQSVTDTRVSF